MTQSQWEQEMCNKILALIQGELYLDFRYLDAALSSLTFTADERLSTIATDGLHLYYCPAKILKLYRANPLYLNRSYLHSVLHCIFRHLFLREGREAVIWNLACDIACEWVIDSLDRPSVKRILTLTRINYYEHLKKDHIPISAPAIYADLLTITDPILQFKLQEEFIVDDHRFWPREKETSPSAKQAGQHWEKIGRKISQDLTLSGREDASVSSSIESQIRLGRKKRSYQEFLKKFTVLKEEPGLDPDEFDAGYYMYGLRVYGNMPLIEPLESREIRKISEFVIVIDTSFSTSGALVQRFLEETFKIIGQRDSFFHKSQIRILQCDNQVHSDTIIKKESDIQALLYSFTLTGGGGTDFRPAFVYVDDLIADGQLKNLKGLLYFTDGKGIFPGKRPAYDTAFVFPEGETPPKVPPWAMKIEFNGENLGA